MIWWKVLFQWCSEFSLIFPKTHTERKRKCFFQLRDLVSYWLQINNNIEILTKRIWSFEATTATTMMARLTAAATDWTITTTTSSFTLLSPSTTTKNGCLLNLRTHSHISSHNDGKCVKKNTLSVDGLTMRMMKYKRVNTNIMHRQRSEHGPTWWWCLQVKCQTIQHFLQLNIPFDLLDRLPFWLCDLPRLLSHNQYLVCSSGRKIYYAVRIGCVWEKRDQRALLLYGLS